MVIERRVNRYKMSRETDEKEMKKQSISHHLLKKDHRKIRWSFLEINTILSNNEPDYSGN